MQCFPTEWSDEKNGKAWLLSMISKFSVKKPYTVLVGVILAIVLGIVSFTKMTADLLPDISLPYVIVMTTYPGASPETVETVVTQPVEAGMAAVSNIESISSVSNENYSMVILEFAQSTDMNAVSLEIRESLDQIEAYWDDSVGSPVIMKMNPDMLPVMIAAAGVEGMDSAQLSAYIEETVVPELESVEGVASVSAVGLLEESVHVMLRQDKLNQVNEKVFAAVDKKMEEAEEQLEEGRKQIEDSEKELADGREEISKGQGELADGEAKLAEGKEELSDKKEETSVKLAEAKRDLLTAKADLEAAKVSMSTNLSTAKKLSETIAELDAISSAPAVYSQAFASLLPSVSGSDADDTEAQKGREQIEALKKTFTESSVLTGLAETSAQMSLLLDTLKALDWTAQENFQTVYGALAGISMAGASELAAQRQNLSDALNALTNGLGLAAFEKAANETLATLEEKLKAVNEGLVEAEKGQLTAALEFAKANAEISLGESQMELIRKQLDTAAAQLESGEKQLTDAREQLLEGEEQLTDAKKEAYDAADMNQVLTADTVKSLLAAQNFSMPAGYVTEEGTDFLVRVGDKPQTVEELKAMPLMDLHMEGVPVITLGDVADVFYTDNSEEIYANVNGSPGVMLTIQKQTGYSTGQVSDLLAERFQKLMEQNEALNMITLMDQGIYIDLVMDSILNNILLGAALAVFILILFLKDIRPTIVIAFSIPVSLVTAVVCMYFSGVTLNVISLSGLALGIGMLVDNSIVVIENIYRLRSEGYSAKEAAIKGAGEVSGAIMASTLTTICVFAPIVFTEGITRQLFVDMGLTIAYSLLASLAIAMTVVPALSSKMLTKTRERKEGRFFSGMTGLYLRLLEGALKLKPLVFIGALFLLGVSAAAAISRGTAFMPDMDSTQLTVNVELEKKATLEQTGELTDQVVERILELDEVENVGAMTNTSAISFSGGSGQSTNTAAIYVVTRKDKELSNQEIGEKILEKTKNLEAEITVDASSMDMSALGGSGISIQVRGRNLDTLYAAAKEVAGIVESVEGTAEINDGLGDSKEELRIIVDRDKAAGYGLTVAQIFTQLSGRLSEADSATSLVTADRDYNVYVRNEKDTLLTRRLIEEVEIEGTDEDGKSVRVPLRELASFETALSANSISRSDQTRYVTVSAAIAEGYNIGKVSAKVEEVLADYALPEGCSLIFSGENEMINDAMEQIFLMLLLAVVFMYLIMVAQFQSLLSPFIIMFTIPLAFTGGFMALFIGGSEISVVALIGFVMLSGVIVNNGIVLIDCINQLTQNGMERREAIMTAGRTRLRPVLMTALTTILAMSAMIFSRDMGAEMAKPMALVSVGGLLYGTLLTLIVIPCVYDSFLRRRPSGKGKGKEAE